VERRSEIHTTSELKRCELLQSLGVMMLFVHRADIAWIVIYITRSSFSW
jgi:hypothetical protein